MNALSCIAIAALLLLSTGLSLAQVEELDSAGSSRSEAESAIEATIRDYVEGWYEGDATRMDRALHDDLAKRIPVRNGDVGALKLRAVTKERMMELTEGGGGGTPGAEYEIEVQHIYGNIASGLVRSAEYLDYVHLVETDDGWKIANILFRTHD